MAKLPSFLFISVYCDLPHKLSSPPMSVLIVAVVACLANSSRFLTKNDAELRFVSRKCQGYGAHLVKLTR
jgi:hypothetical protein